MGRDLIRMQNITLQLSDNLMQRAAQTADVLAQPLETLLAAMLDATLPDIADAPLAVQAELARMTWFSSQELWAIARSQMAPEKQQEIQRLSALQQQRPLHEEEQEMINLLRDEYSRVTLCKARAYALLSIRSGQPLLQNL